MEEGGQWQRAIEQRRVGVRRLGQGAMAGRQVVHMAVQLPPMVAVCAAQQWVPPP
jgi:hypothetical protein